MLVESSLLDLAAQKYEVSALLHKSKLFDISSRKPAKSRRSRMIGDVPFKEIIDDYKSTFALTAPRLVHMTILLANKAI